MSAVENLFTQLRDAPAFYTLAAGAVLLSFMFFTVTSEKRYSGLPEVTLDQKDSKGYRFSHHAWMLNAKTVLEKGLKECASCFQVLTGSGYKVIVPNRFADELKSHPDLSFNEAFAKDLFINYPGFDGFRQGLQHETFMPEVVRVKLTQSLGLITDDLVEETDDALQCSFGDDDQWQTRPMKQDMLDIVARLSARVFLGKELCRNEDWLRISKEYTVDSFQAANDMRMCSALLRPIQYWFIPTCTRLRQEVRDARKIILPEVERRRIQAEKAVKAGKKPPKAADAIAWMAEMSKGRSVDYVAAQLSLSSAAIHTTSETTTNCIMQLCDTPEIVQPLREEMINVLSTDGWSKTSLYKMKLLDSFLKEVQRTNGLASISMNRMVKKDITLSDGTVLRKGTRLMVSDEKVNDASLYSQPEKFDVARFLRLREESGSENRHQFVSATSDHMGFGYGQHACPGRFFASNEMKIALCFFLLRYDCRYIPGESRPPSIEIDASKMVNPTLKVQVRRRKEEIDLISPQGTR